MGSKIKPARFDCYANALPDEEMFILLARDPVAADIVRLWARFRRKLVELGDKPSSDAAMIHEAEDCASTMERWREHNDGRWRLPQPKPAPSGSAIGDVIKERHRQVVDEGYDATHDDAHANGELALAAAAYAAHRKHPAGRLWPWHAKSWKPRSHRENCVRAAAFLIAEIERLDRAHERDPGRPVPPHGSGPGHP